MATYFEKLKDPRWQKKRLEVLQAHEFACELCYDDSTMLHVHHKQYFKGRDPWEYEIEQLTVLCEDCHKEHHSSDDELHLVTSFLPLGGPNSRSSVASLVAGFSEQEMLDEVNAREYLIGVVAGYLVSDYKRPIEQVRRIARLCRRDARGFMQAMINYSESQPDIK